MGLNRYNISEVTEHWRQPCCLVKKYFFGLIKIKGDPVNGVVYSTYPNGNLLEEYEFINGIKNGLHKYYNINGVITYELNLQNNIFHGVRIERNVNNQITLLEHYENGHRHGLCKYYDEEGKIKSEGNCEYDYETGLWKKYDGDGKLTGIEDMGDVYIKRPNCNYPPIGVLERNPHYKFSKISKIFIEEVKTKKEEVEKVKLDKNRSKNKISSDEMVIIKISGCDNLGGTNQVELEVTMNEIEELKSLTDQIERVVDKEWSFEIYGCNEGEIEHIMSKYSTLDYIIVRRFQVFDKRKGVYFDVREVDGELYYLRCPIPNPGEKESFTQLTEQEVKEFNEEWDYSGDNRYFGIDVYTNEQFSLELELKTGY